MAPSSEQKSSCCPWKKRSAQVELPAAGKAIDSEDNRRMALKFASAYPVAALQVHKGASGRDLGRGLCGPSAQALQNSVGAQRRHVTQRGSAKPLLARRAIGRVGTERGPAAVARPD